MTRDPPHEGLGAAQHPGAEGKVREVDAVVVGAGFGGLYALYRLRDQGFSAIGFEAGSDVGGTWYWNRYPGARCDVPSLYYSYTWSEDLRREWRWSEKYATQPEILRYMQYVADRFDLRPLIEFETRVVRAVFDESERIWRVETNKGDRVRARFCIMATGNLSVPNDPRVPGAETFLEDSYHTGRWPAEEVDFRGRKVSVIGTGSSAVQAIPLIAEQAEKLVVFQRTPNFSVPARNGPIGEQEHQHFEAQLPGYLASLESPEFGRISVDASEAQVPSREEQWKRYEDLWEQGGGIFLYAFPNLLTNDEVNEGAREFVREKIRATVKDPVRAEALCANDFPLGVKRICVDTNYYETFNRPNVDLVNLREEALERITPTGVRTSRREFEFDAIVFATGFDAMTGALLAMDIRGRNGRTLKDAWAEGPRAYLGLAVAGFPNLFILTGPGSPSVIGNVLANCEHHVDLVMTCLERMRAEGLHTIEAETAAQDAWVEHVAEVAGRTLFPKANSWYLGANIPGKPRVFMPYVGNGYRHTCSEIVAAGLRGFVLA